MEVEPPKTRHVVSDPIPLRGASKSIITAPCWGIIVAQHVVVNPAAVLVPFLGECSSDVEMNTVHPSEKNSGDMTKAQQRAWPP